MIKVVNTDTDNVTVVMSRSVLQHLEDQGFEITFPPQTTIEPSPYDMVNVAEEFEFALRKKGIRDKDLPISGITLSRWKTGQTSPTGFQLGMLTTAINDGLDPRDVMYRDQFTDELNKLKVSFNEVLRLIGMKKTALLGYYSGTYYPIDIMRGAIIHCLKKHENADS